MGRSGFTVRTLWATSPARIADSWQLAATVEIASLVSDWPSTWANPPITAISTANTRSTVECRRRCEQMAILYVREEYAENEATI